jgi:hypothetical protein
MDMSKTLLSTLCAVSLALSFATHAAPHTLRVVEDAAETIPLDLALTAPEAGRINARLCDSCELLTLRVVADTAVFLHGARTTLQAASERSARGATVIFDRESRVVRRAVNGQIPNSPAGVGVFRLNGGVMSIAPISRLHRWEMRNVPISRIRHFEGCT